MAAEQDFQITVTRAAGFTDEALIAARAAGRPVLPRIQREHLSTARRCLERAQDELFKAQAATWGTPPRRQGRQLTIEDMGVAA